MLTVGHLERAGQATAKQNRIRFSQKWDAFWEGYAPCKKCMGQGAIE